MMFLLLTIWLVHVYGTLNFFGMGSCIGDNRRPLTQILRHSYTNNDCNYECEHSLSCIGYSFMHAGMHRNRCALHEQLKNWHGDPASITSTTGPSEHFPAWCYRKTKIPSGKQCCSEIDVDVSFGVEYYKHGGDTFNSKPVYRNVNMEYAIWYYVNSWYHGYAKDMIEKPEHGFWHSKDNVACPAEVEFWSRKGEPVVGMSIQCKTTYVGYIPGQATYGSLPGEGYASLPELDFLLGAD